MDRILNWRAAIAVAASAAALAAGFAGTSYARRAPTAPHAAGASGGNVIGKLSTRRYRITMETGGRYTVETKDGHVVARHASIDELLAQDPEAGEVVRGLFAGMG